jgi:hypothetical protein
MRVACRVNAREAESRRSITRKGGAVSTFPGRFVAPLLMLLALVAPAQAITGNYVKDFEHPFVGLLVLYDENGEFMGRCSGSLLTPVVFLTAGHCVDGATSARVYFQQDAGANYDPETGVDAVTGYPDTCAAGTEGVVCATSKELHSYGYPAGFPEQKDVGLVILDQPITVSGYGVLPFAGLLDVVASEPGIKVLLTDSGYGLSYTNPAKTTSFRERLMATTTLQNLRSALTDGYNMQASNNPGRNGGGTCFGDSGGPVLFDDGSSNVIVSVTSFGLSANTCAGVDFSYRVDQQAVIDWILATVPPGEVNDIAFATP